MTPLTLVLPLALLGACAESIAPDDPVDTGASADDTGMTGEPVDQEISGETTTTVLDATDYEAWVYYDLDTGEVVGEAGGWDLALQRYLIALNGGISGEGGVDAAILADVAFEELEQAPAEGYRSDEADADDDGVDELVFDEWYDYDQQTHVLTTKGLVYVVRTTDGAAVKVAIDDYYSDAGTPGVLTFRWAHLPGA